MDQEIESSESHKPIHGWVCVAIGIGFITAIVVLLAAVREFGGQ